MNRKYIWAGLSLTAMIAAAAIAISIFFKPSYRGVSINPPYAAPDFELIDQRGDVFRLSDQRGSIVLLFFGYASCPDVCPATLSVLKQSLARLTEEQADQIKVVFITVDPSRDTSEMIQQYVEQFNPAFLGLSGSEESLSAVWSAYGVFREIGAPNENGFYQVGHTARVHVIDQDGNLHLSFPFGITIEDVVHDLKLMLK